MALVLRTKVDAVTSIDSRSSILRDVGQKPFAPSRLQRIQKQVHEDTSVAPWPNFLSGTSENLQQGAPTIPLLNPVVRTPPHGNSGFLRSGEPHVSRLSVSERSPADVPAPSRLESEASVEQGRRERMSDSRERRLSACPSSGGIYQGCPEEQKGVGMPENSRDSEKQVNLKPEGKISLTNAILVSPDTEVDRAMSDTSIAVELDRNKGSEKTLVAESVASAAPNGRAKSRDGLTFGMSAVESDEPNISLEETAMIEIQHDLDSTSTTPMYEEDRAYGSYSSEIEIGCVIGGRYEILSEIARGGYGIVYRARQIGVERIVALKRLRSQSDPSVVQRFMREMQIIKNLVHPNTIQLIDAGMDDNHTYIVMEYIDGESLYSILKKERKLPLKRAINIVRQVLKSVNEAHQCGVIHRDIKPSNILIRRVIGESDFVKVLDFGIAKTKNANDMKITRSGHVMGTPHYLAPESILYGEHMNQSDIFAVGLIFCEMITGTQVLKGTMSQVSHILVDGNPIDIPKEYDGTRLAKILRKALAKRPGDRYAFADDMIRDLNELENIIIKNDGFVPRDRRNRKVSIIWFIASASFALLCLMLMLYFAMGYAWA